MSPLLTISLILPLRILQESVCRSTQHYCWRSAIRIGPVYNGGFLGWGSSLSSMDYWSYLKEKRCDNERIWGRRRSSSLFSRIGSPIAVLKTLSRSRGAEEGDSVSSAQLSSVRKSGLFPLFYPSMLVWWAPKLVGGMRFDNYTWGMLRTREKFSFWPTATSRIQGNNDNSC